MLVALPRMSAKSAVGWSFAAGWVSGLGVLYWVYPTCRWGGVNPAVSLLAVGALSGYTALFWLLFGGAVWVLSRRPLWERPFWAAAAWTSSEALRARLLSGFPWTPLSCSQWQVPPHLQLAEIGGGYAVSFLILLVNGTLAAALLGVFERPRRWLASVPGLVAIVALIAGSVALWRRPLPGGPAFDVAVIQGNIDQYKKWDAAYEEEIVRSYSTLTREAALKKPVLIVWPETAVPGWIPNDPKITRWLTDAARESRTFLLIGAVSRQERGDFNAAFLLSPKGEIVGQYRKEHLVPFGEYVPLRPLLSRCVGVLNDLGSFSPGGEVSGLSFPEARLGVNICFEGLFPHLIRRFTVQGAQVLVNLTNDGWYRDTAAPEQHFAANVLRAVENRRWVVRAANTGYSGFISPRGEITGRTNLLEPAILFGRPQPMEGLTFYARHGDVFVGVCAFFLLIGLGVVGLRNSPVKKRS